MANKSAVIPDQANVNDKTGIIERFIDIGNGEHARVVALGSSGAGGSGNASAAEVIAGESHLGSVGGDTKKATAEFTRPSNATPYAAKDVVGPAAGSAFLAIADAGRIPGGSGYITKVRLETDQEANVVNFRVWFFSAFPATLINDNDPMGLVYADAAKRVGYVDIGAMTSEVAAAGDAAQAQNTEIRLAYECAVGVTGLIFVVETPAIFTPGSAQKFFLSVTFERN